MRKILAVVATAAWLVGGAAPAHAQVAAVAVPGSFAAGWATRVLVAPDDQITLINADVAPHDFTARDDYLSKKDAKKAPWCKGLEKGKCPIFWSETIGSGQSTEVLGLENLEAGRQYTFFCTRHPSMTGILIGS